MIITVIFRESFRKPHSKKLSIPYHLTLEYHLFVLTSVSGTIITHFKSGLHLGTYAKI